MAIALDVLIEKMAPSAPDFSLNAVVLPNQKAVGFAKHYLQKHLGGLLPRFYDLKSYLAARLSQKLEGQPITETTTLLHFLDFWRQKEPALPFERAMQKAQSLLSILSTLSEYGISKDRFLALAEKLPQDRLERLYQYKQEFPLFLSRLGLFSPALSKETLKQISPLETDYFINILELTPPVENFLKKVPADRILADSPRFHDDLVHFGEMTPGFEHFQKLKGRITLIDQPYSDLPIEFSILKGMQTVPHFLGRELLEIDKKAGLPLSIVLLDETLAYPLWKSVLKWFLPEVNLSVGIPLPLSSIGARMLQELEKKDPVDLDLLQNLITEQLKSPTLDRDEGFAAREVLSCLDLFKQWFQQYGDFTPAEKKGLLKNALALAKFYIEGSQEAAIQVTGLGNSPQQPNQKTILLPISDGIFPPVLPEELYLNQTLLPEIREIHLRTKELQLRQWLGTSRALSIAAIADETLRLTPSYYFYFLRNEFEQKEQTRHYLFQDQLPLSPARPNSIRLTAAEQSALKTDFEYSFTTLANLFACPVKFYFQNFKRLSLPDEYDEESNTRDMGTFIHYFIWSLGQAKKQPPAWRAHFEELWEKAPALPELYLKIEKLVTSPAAPYYKNQMLAYLERCIQALDKLADFPHPILSPGKYREHQVKFTCQGLKLKGNIDKILEHQGADYIIDYKFKPNNTRQIKADIPLEQFLLIRNDAGDVVELKDEAQLFIYMYLYAKTDQAWPKGLKARYLFLKEYQPDLIFPENAYEEWFVASGEAFITALVLEIFKVIASPVLSPRYTSAACQFCRLQILCQRPDLYRQQERNR